MQNAAGLHQKSISKTGRQRDSTPVQSQSEQITSRQREKTVAGNEGGPMKTIRNRNRLRDAADNGSLRILVHSRMA